MRGRSEGRGSKGNDKVRFKSKGFRKCFYAARIVTSRGIILRGRSGKSNLAMMKGKPPLLQHLMGMIH